jgi:hypothetical protein
MIRKKLVAGSLGALLLVAGIALPAFAQAGGGGTPTATILGGGNADGMVKMVFLLKRHPGMSREDFLKYYENHHARLGEKYVPNAVRYVRRFLDPLPGAPPEMQYDVLTELWFANQAEMDKALKLLADPKIHAEIQADEEVLFDRPAMLAYVITERDSKMGHQPRKKK